MASLPEFERLNAKNLHFSSCSGNARPILFLSPGDNPAKHSRCSGIATGKIYCASDTSEFIAEASDRKLLPSVCAVLPESEGQVYVLQLKKT